MTAGPRRTVPRWARVGGGLILAVAGLAIAFRRVDLDELGEQLAGARWGWFLAAAALTVFAVLMRAWRWQAPLAPGRRGHRWPVTARVTGAEESS